MSFFYTLGKILGFFLMYHDIWTCCLNIWKWHNLTGTEQINVGCGISKIGEEKQLVFKKTSTVGVKHTLSLPGIAEY